MEIFLGYDAKYIRFCPMADNILAIGQVEGVDIFTCDIAGDAIHEASNALLMALKKCQRIGNS